MSVMISAHAFHMAKLDLKQVRRTDDMHMTASQRHIHSRCSPPLQLHIEDRHFVDQTQTRRTVAFEKRRHAAQKTLGESSMQLTY